MATIFPLSPIVEPAVSTTLYADDVCSQSSGVHARELERVLQAALTELTSCLADVGICIYPQKIKYVLLG